MKYGEIRWKVEKVVFQIDGGAIKRKFEVDEGRTLLIKKIERDNLSVEMDESSLQTA